MYTGREDGPALNEESVEISLVNDLRELARVAAQVDAFCEALDLEARVSYAVKLGLEEILVNTIKYGYDDDEWHRIEVIVRMEYEALIVVIVDEGVAFDVSAQTRPEIGTSLEDRAPDGLGLFLVHQMLDGVAYERRDGCNVVTLTKKARTDGADPPGWPRA